MGLGFAAWLVQELYVYRNRSFYSFNSRDLCSSKTHPISMCDKKKSA